MTWTPRDVERLRELAATGLSSSAIGREMGVTKGMVIGKCRRNGIPLLVPSCIPLLVPSSGRPLGTTHNSVSVATAPSKRAPPRLDLVAAAGDARQPREEKPFDPYVHLRNLR